MGNSVKGIVDFEADGKTWSLQFSTNGLCALEDATGEDTMSFIARMQAESESRMSMKDVRLMFWSGLQEHHDGITLKDAGSLMAKVDGGLMAAVGLYERALELAFPTPDDSADDAPGKGKGTR